MAVYNRSVLTSILKEDYAPALVEEFKRQNVLYDLLSEGPKEDIRGLQLYIPIKTGRSASGGAGVEGGSYPTAGAAAFSQFKVNSAIYRNLFELTVAGVEDTQTPSAAYLRSAEEAMREGMQGIKTAIGRDMYGTRHSVLGVIDSVGAAPTYTIRNAHNASEDDLRGTRYLLPGAVVNVVNINAGTGVATLRVNATTAGTTFTVSSVTNVTTVVLSAVATAAAQDDIIVPEGAITASATVGNGIYGLAEIVDNGSGAYAQLFAAYGGLDRSSYSVMDSVLIDKGATALTYQDIENAHQATLMASGEEMTPQNGVLICHPSVRQVIKFWKYADIRYAPTEAVQGIGDEKLSYNPGTGNFMIHSDRMAIPACLWGVNKNWMNYYETTPLGLDEHDGGVLKVKRDSSGQPMDTLQGMMRWRGQMFAPKPHAHWKIVDISGTTPEFGQGVGFVKPA